MDTLEILGDPILDEDLWRSLLAGRDEAFACLVPGARVAVVPRAVAQSNDGTMLMCEAQPGAMTTRFRRFRGFEKCSADVVFVINDEARDRILSDAMAGLATLRRLVRRGQVVLYFLKCEGALIEAGFEEFLESLGLTILGACR